jgi:hypothetical protein
MTMTRTKTITIAAGCAAVMALGGALLLPFRSDSLVGDAGPPRAEVAQAGGRDFTPGARRSYEIEAGSELSFATPEGPRGFAIHLTGTWELTVVGVSGDRVELRAALRGPELQTRADGAGQAAPALPPGALDAPAYLVARRDGRIEEVLVEPATPALARDLLRSLALATQLVVPAGAGGAWTVDERDGVGTYHASYVRDGDLVTKAKQQYRPSAADLARREVAIDSGTRYRLGRDGWPQSVDADEAIGVAAAGGMPAIALRGRHKLRLVRADRDPLAIGAFGRARAQLVAVTGGGAPGGGAAPIDDRSTLGGARYHDLLDALRRVDLTADPQVRGQLMARLVALFRLDAAAHDEAVAEIRGGADETVASGLIAALGAAGTGSAQSAIREVLADEGIPTGVRAHAAIALGMTAAPDAQTVAALDELTRHDEPRARQLADLALGNAAHHTSDDALRTRAVERLLELWASAQDPGDQLILLEAMGNAGDPRILPAVRQGLGSPQGGVRGAAARALRFVVDAGADQLLAAVLVQDPAPEVRIAAGDAAGYRALAPLLGVLGTTIERDPDEGVRASIVQRMASRLHDTAALRPLIERAQRDRAESVREAARRALAAG